jgi:hypothetical protein
MQGAACTTLSERGVVSTEDVMKARQLISNASYGPDTLKVLFAAFDDAWRQLAPKCGDNPLAIEAARIRLANTILSLATEDSKDPEQLKAAALRITALGEPT